MSLQTFQRLISPGLLVARQCTCSAFWGSYRWVPQGLFHFSTKENIRFEPTMTLRLIWFNSSNLVTLQRQKSLKKRASVQLEKKDTKTLKHNLCTFMALYNCSKDCSCVCKYISIIRHFSEYREQEHGICTVTALGQ